MINIIMAKLVDAPRSQLDNTVKLYDQFYNFDLVVEADQFELVYSYFFDITKDKNIANNFSTIMFRIANITGENVLTLLDEMKKTSSLNANALLTYYLNSLKSKTTLYGIANVPMPNYTVQRNVVQ